MIITEAIGAQRGVVPRAVARDHAAECRWSGRAGRRRHKALAREQVDDRVVVEVAASARRIVRIRRGQGAVAAIDTDAGVRVGHVVGRALKVFALAGIQLFVETILGGQRDVGEVAQVETVGCAEAVLLAAFFLRLRDEAVHFELINRVARDDVDHAADCVRTVDGRGAVFQDFDALDDRLRNDVEVERRNGAARTRRTRTLAVDQNQRAGVTATAKVDRLGADTAVCDEVLEGVVELGRARSQRRALQQRSGVDEAFERCGFGRDHLDRRGRCEFVARDERAGNNDLFLTGFVNGFWGRYRFNGIVCRRVRRFAFLCITGTCKQKRADGGTSENCPPELSDLHSGTAPHINLIL